MGLTLLAYVPALRAGYIWDDDSYLTANPTLQSAEGLRRIWFELRATPQYYPLVFTTFWFERRLWGAAPFGYHLVNVLLHAAGAILLWRTLVRLRCPGAWLGAALFALHPVHVESVAWITERKNVLSGALYLASAWAYLNFVGVDRPPVGDAPARRWGFYALSLAAFVGAVLSKTVTVTLPVALALALWWGRPPLRPPQLLPLAPMIVIGIPLGALTAWIERYHLGGEGIGAQGPEWAFSWLERCVIAGRAFWFYLGKLLWPINLTFIYPRWEIGQGGPTEAIWPLGVLMLLAVLWAGRGLWGRGPLAAAAFFAVTLSPALGFFNVYPMLFSFVADHFQYLASIGPIALAAAGLERLSRRIGGLGTRLIPRRPPIAPTARIVIAAVVLAPFWALTFRQGRIYRDEATLWTDTLAKNPTAWIAHNNLGNLRLAEGNGEAAIEHYLAVTRLKPDYAVGYNNLGIALHRLRRADEAISQFDRAIELNPVYADAMHNLAFVLAGQGRKDEALGWASEAVRLKPDSAQAHNILGITLVALGDRAAAREAFLRALELDPNLTDARRNLAVVERASP